MGKNRREWIIAGGVVLALTLLALNAAVALDLIDRYILGILTITCINIILAVSLNLTVGFTGQLSIGHAGFMAIGAYVSALLSMFLQWPLWLSLPAGAAAAALAGLLVGLPTLRLRGDYLAIATLGFGEIIRVLILNIPITGGSRGLAGIPNLTNFFVAEGVMLISLLVIYNLIHSSHGRAMLGVREDEVAAESVGINTTWYKVLSFAGGAFFAGAAGSLYAHYMMFIDPRSFTFMKSVEILVMTVMGGLGSFAGSVVAAGVLTFLPEYLRQFTDYRMIIYSGLLIALMLVQGAFGGKKITDLFRGGEKQGINKEAGEHRGATGA